MSRSLAFNGPPGDCFEEEREVSEADVIETVARAIRVVVAKRVGSTATPWGGLFEYQREAYREEAKAALNEIEALRRQGSGA